MCVTLFLLLFGIFLSSLPLFYECKKLDVCTFQVNSTDFCPSNQTEWKKRSSKMNCSETNAYMCVPNERFTQLVEFCYNHRAILIFKGTCLYFSSTHSDVDVYDCRKFEDGCPSSHYLSSEIYEYPSCIQVQNGCFAAEAACKSQPSQRDNRSIDSTLPISLGVSIPACFLLCTCMLLLYIIRKKRKSLRRKVRRGGDEEIYMYMNVIERLPFLGYERRETLENYKESPIETTIFDQWKQDDINFISTKACEEVEKNIKSRNLVIVAGHSGSGKSAIIQHIALKYRRQGWTVRQVKKVEDILDEFCSSRFQKYKTMLVFNDPLGKESFDELLNNSWQTNEDELRLYLKTAKLVMSSRIHIICDTRVTGYFLNQSLIVNIEGNKYKLSVDEKRQILTINTFDMNLSDKDRHKIFEVERYFPLLCKLYSSNKEYENKGIEFFTEPVTVLKKEILGYRHKDKGKYCALALLVLFNNDLCVNDLLKNKDNEYKYKHMLKLCGLPNGTPPSAIGDNFFSMKDCFVKKIGDTYHFYHDFVMEVTTHVFGTDYPAETIKHADIGFLRRRVKLGNCDEHHDSFTIYLSDEYINGLGQRLFTELLGERLVDVVLNPCLRNEKIIEVMKKEIEGHPGYQQMLLETKKITIDKQELDRTSKSLRMTKINFLELENEVSPLFTLIVFCHTQLSQLCVNILQQNQIRLLISAMCCNGSIELFSNVSKDRRKEFLEETWGGLHPIHIVSAFHNYKLLGELIRSDVHVNQKTDDNGGWTPLILAAGNDTQEYGDYNNGESVAKRRDKTVQLLLSNGANINLCNKNGASPLHIACQNGHESTVRLLLNNGANINLDEEDGASPLLIACQNGHESVVHLCLHRRADINLCKKNGVGPLYVACQHGHDSIVHSLLRNGANINLCSKQGKSPLYKACQNGHDSSVNILLRNGAGINLCSRNGSSPLYIAGQNGHYSTVQLLLDNGANINLCRKNGKSPLYIACQNGYDKTVRILLRNRANINFCSRKGSSPLYIACQKGHDSVVQRLMSYGADINLCMEDGSSPLYIACQNGHDSIVQRLMSKGANINLCMKDGSSPLYIACQKGHDSTVQLLLSNGADINLCIEDGSSPLFLACQNGYDKTVQLLLSKGADIDLCAGDISPLYIACQKGYDKTVHILLRNKANINLCSRNGSSPLYIACQMGHDSTVKLLLKNGANINLCSKNGASPLYVACENGHDRTVRLLMSKEADVNLCLKDGVSPLYVAFYRRCYTTFDILIKNGTDTSLFCGWQVNPDLKNCFDKHDRTAEFLMQKDNIEKNMHDPDSYFSLFVSCQVERVIRMMFDK